MTKARRNHTRRHQFTFSRSRTRRHAPPRFIKPRVENRGRSQYGEIKLSQINYTMLAKKNGLSLRDSPKALPNKGRLLVTFVKGRNYSSENNAKTTKARVTKLDS
jgi:hypothetical protein